MKFFLRKMPRTSKPKTVFKTPKPSRALAHAARLAKKNQQKPTSSANPSSTNFSTPKAPKNPSESGSDDSYMSLERSFTKGPEIKLKNKDEVSPKKTERRTGEPKDEIVFQVYECNGEKFDGIITRKDCKNLWIELGRVLTELRRISRERVKGKYLKICYYLKEPIKITEISRRAEFSIEKTGEFGSTIYSLRLPDYYNIACKIGDIATVSFKTSLIGIPDNIVIAWMNLFGKVQGNMR